MILRVRGVFALGICQPHGRVPPSQNSPCGNDQSDEYSKEIYLRDFKNATFYVDCFLYLVDLMLFPMKYFIMSREKQ